MSTVDKGRRWVHRVDEYLQNLGFATVTRPWMTSGDDITARSEYLELSTECKDHRVLAFSSWLDQAEKNAPVGAIPVVIAHRLGHTDVDSAYVVMTGRSFRDLLEVLGI